MGKEYFNLGDEIVLDSLRSLSTLETSPVIVGGLCLQLHARQMPRLLRNTIDADLITPENITYEYFLQHIAPHLEKNLRGNGYQTQVKRGRGNHSLKVMKNQNKPDYSQFLVHFTLFSPDIWVATKDYVDQQITYATEVTPRHCDPSVKVASLEEVLPLKIRRAVRFGSEREALVGPVYATLIESAKRSNWGFLAGQPIADWVQSLDRMQAEIASQHCPEKVSTYKLSKDIYDICLGARVVADTLNKFDRDRYEHNLRRILAGDSPNLA